MLKLKKLLVLLCGASLMFANLAAYANIPTRFSAPNPASVAQKPPQGQKFLGPRSRPENSFLSACRVKEKCRSGLDPSSSPRVYMQARYYDPKIGRFLSPDPIGFSPNKPWQFNLYWYAVGNPYRFVDPDGKYICNGSKSQCGMISKALKKVSDAAGKLAKGSKGQNALNAVVKLYGKAGQKNGVVVNFSSSLGPGKAGQTEMSGTKVKITFNPKAINRYLGALGHKAVETAAAVAHEGQHGVDFRSDRISNRPGSIYSSEERAYRTQSYVNQAEGVRSVYNLWKPGITPEQQDSAIGMAAAGMPQRVCPSGGC